MAIIIPNPTWVPNDIAYKGAHGTTGALIDMIRVNSSNQVEIDTGAVGTAFGGSLSVAATEKIYFDGLSGHTYMNEDVDNRIRFVTFSNERFAIDIDEVVVNDNQVDVDFRVEGDATDYLFFTDASIGNVFIHDSANANNTQGLTVNQLAADDHALTLKSSDVNTVLTSGLASKIGVTVEADDYFAITKRTATLGGVKILSLAEDAGADNVIEMYAIGGQGPTGKTNTGTGLISLRAGEHDGANALADVAANGNIFSVSSYVTSAWQTKLLLDEDGDLMIGGDLTPFSGGDNTGNVGLAGQRFASGHFAALSNDDSAAIAVTGGFDISSGFVARSVTAGITASVTQTQGQGALTTEFNQVSVCANANDTVTLPAAAAGRVCIIVHNGAQASRFIRLLVMI